MSKVLGQGVMTYTVVVEVTEDGWVISTKLHVRMWHCSVARMAGDQVVNYNSPIPAPMTPAPTTNPIG